MLEKTAGQPKQNQAHGGTCQCGCGSKPQTPVVIDEKAANEQALREEEERARNKRVRAPRTAPGPDAPPPFSDHSGSL
jgi:hypothetical protein